MRGSDWRGVCGVPGIGTSVKNIHKDPSSLWDTKQQSGADASVRTRLVRIFKLRKWKAKSKESDIKLKSPFAFPQLKEIKSDPRVQSESKMIENNKPVVQNKRSIKNYLKKGKSLPLETSLGVLPYIKTSVAQSNIKQTTSVATQTDPCNDGHRKIRRVNARQQQVKKASFLDKTSDNEKILFESNDNNKSSKSATYTDFEQECNFEVSKTLCQEYKDLQEEVLHTRYMEENSITISEMVSPTLIMETEMDTDTDTDSDDEDDNIYEEVLNHENYRKKHHLRKLSTTSSLYSSTLWNDSRQDGCVLSHQHQNSYFASNPYKIVEKKKLNRTAKSNLSSNIFITHQACGHSDNNQLHAVNRRERSKAQGIKKSLSEKFSHLRVIQRWK